MTLITKQGVALWLRRFGLYRPAVAGMRQLGALRFRFSPDARSVTVGGATADFRVSSPNEFNTLRKLPEREVVASVLDSLRPDDTFYDVGANIGLYSCLAAAVVEGRVVAFEPEPKNAARLRENVRLNGADVDVFECALSDSNAPREFAVRLFDGGHQTGPAGHSFATGDEEAGETITVESAVGDEFVAERGVPVPNVVKIDVEGAEWAVLAGLESTLSHPDCRVVYCELHEDRLRSQGHSTQAVVERLTRMGFDVEIPFTPYGEPFLRAEKVEG